MKITKVSQFQAVLLSLFGDEVCWDSNICLVASCMHTRQVNHFSPGRGKLEHPHAGRAHLTRLSFSPGKLGGQDSFESIESYDSCDRLTQSWSSQSSFQSLQRVPSYDSFDSEDYPAALPNHKPKGTFKDYVRDRADMNKDKPVIPAAALAGYTGRVTLLRTPPRC